MRVGVSRVAAGLSLVTALASPCAGQISEKWSFVVTPYGWIAGLGGQVGFNSVVTDVDLRFVDIVDHLTFGAMATVEARRGPLLFATDAIYISLADSKAFAVRGASGDVTLDQRETIVQPVVGYTIAGDFWSVDLLTGARYWNLSTDFGLDPAQGESRSRSGTRDWLDVTGGARVSLTPVPFVHLSAGGDGGGGGSRSTWQAVGSASIDLTADHFSLLTGYRYLAVDYDHAGFLFDTHTSGWLIGLNLRY